MLFKHVSDTSGASFSGTSAVTVTSSLLVVAFLFFWATQLKVVEIAKNKIKRFFIFIII